MNKSVKSEPKEEAPWKVRVTVTKNENEVDVKHEEEEYDLLNPWTTMIKREREPESEDDQEEAEMQMPSAPAKHPSQTANHDQEEALPQTPEEPPGQKEMQEMMASINSQDSPWSHLLRVQNYAAMEASFGNFGLIPMGVEKGMRSLIVHVPRGKQSYYVFQNIRPGGTIRVVRSCNVPHRRKNDPQTLHVRYTTPTKYFPPGAKLSCLTIGVDDAEWQSLMTKPRHI